jgi:hypothetical protein
MNIQMVLKQSNARYIISKSDIWDECRKMGIDSHVYFLYNESAFIKVVSNCYGKTYTHYL